ncbi:MAG: hypothetical protein EZS28_000140 [Streblomastix strix]|uniref:Uncharacterized protein n=1 Tax=Streblomastix strix TaxID=222440 RepID=A0A5J4XAX1_9EUKA|nr:MAG: hypothetical protein EZS28_000140 [Streblomastix strix]
MGAETSWIDQLSPIRLQNKHGRRGRTGQMQRKYKFKEKFDEELKQGVVREAQEQEILYFNPTYTVPKAGWGQMEESFRLQQTKLRNITNSFHYGERKYDKGVDMIRRLCEITRLQESLSPYQCIYKVTEIFWVPYQMQNVYIRGATIRMKRIPDGFLQEKVGV